MPFTSWAEMHGAITHFPVAFLIAGAAFDIGAIIFRKPVWREVSFWMLVGAVVMSVPSLVTGWLAGDKYTLGAAEPPAVFLWHRIAGFATGGLASFLLLWRVMAKDKLTRHARAASIVVATFIAAVVGYTGHLGGQMVFGGRDESPIMATDPTPKAGPTKPAVDLDPKLILAGEKLFMSEDQGCLNCHKMGSKGGTSAVNLTRAGLLHDDINWQIEHLKDPAKMKPGSTMPAYNELKPEELKALAVYLVSRK